MHSLQNVANNFVIAVSLFTANYKKTLLKTSTTILKTIPLQEALVLDIARLNVAALQKITDSKNELETYSTVRTKPKTLHTVYTCPTLSELAIIMLIV